MLRSIFKKNGKNTELIYAVFTLAILVILFVIFFSMVDVPLIVRICLFLLILVTAIADIYIRQARRQNVMKEEMLIKSNQRFSLMFDKAPLGLALMDPVTGIIYKSNAKYEQIIGRTREEMKNLSWMSITPPEDLRADMDNMALMNAHKISGFKMSKRYVRPDGEIVWAYIHLSLIDIDDKEGAQYLCMVEDITEKRKMELELELSNERLILATTSTSDGLWDWDIKAEEVYYSPRFMEVSGHNPFELPEVINSYFDMIHPDDLEKVKHKIDNHFKTKAKYSVEHRLKHKDGNYIWCQSRGIASWNDNGEPIRMTGFITNINERKIAENDLKSHKEHLEKLVETKTANLAAALKKAEIAQSEAEQANRAKSEFLSNMSHELRTPMHAILSYSALGLKNIQNNDNEKIVKYLSNINVSGERLTNLLNNLLDLSKLEAGRYEFNLIKDNFKNVVDCTLMELDSLVQKKHLVITTTYYAEDTNAVFDKNRIMQVMVNLLSNAIKFSSENDNIIIKVSASADKSAMLCSIEDEGVGIPTDELEKVFDKFIQSSKTKTGAGGTGLGLAICREIIKGHGGSIWAENGETKGTVFKFLLPVS